MFAENDVAKQHACVRLHQRTEEHMVGSFEMDSCRTRSHSGSLLNYLGCLLCKCNANVITGGFTTGIEEIFPLSLSDRRLCDVIKNISVLNKERVTEQMDRFSAICILLSLCRC